MGQAKKPYGPWSQKMLTRLRAHQQLKVEAFVLWLDERGITIDRSLVSHWIAGRAHLPADALPLLAEFSGHPELVFGDFLRAIGCELQKLPTARAQTRELADHLLEAGGAVGNLQDSLLRAKSPDSPGGEIITDDERHALSDEVDTLIQQLTDLKATLQGGGR